MILSPLMNGYLSILAAAVQKYVNASQGLATLMPSETIVARGIKSVILDLLRLRGHPYRQPLFARPKKGSGAGDG